MKRYRLSRTALRDIDEACAWIAKDDLNAALRLWTRFDAAFAKLERIPRLGHHRTDRADERHRFWTVGSYLIVYVVTDDRVEVARVLHAARDVRRLLQEERDD